MDNAIVKESLTQDVPVSSGLPPPRQVLNQSTEYQVIEKAAKLLKQVEQHWKKSLFQNRLQFSPISDSHNSSESEHYIEKLAAIKFKDASFRNKQRFPVNEAMHHGYRRESSLEQNVLMSYDVVSNYFDLIGSKDAKMTNIPSSSRRRDENCLTKCPRCLDKAKTQNEAQKKSVSVLPKQQYVLKQNTYSRRGGFLRQSRGGGSTQISPRSNESLLTARTYASAYSSPSPKNKTSLIGGRSRMSSSNPDLRNINAKELSRSRHHNVSRCCHNFCSTEQLNKTIDSLNKSEVANHETLNVSNVSVVNIKSSNQEGSIPEVNPRKITSAPDKFIIIQHLPQVDIRPELSKQSGPVISIDAEATVEEQQDIKNANIGVFNYIHKNTPKNPHKEFKPYTNYTRYKSISGSNGCSEEESFAAQLELRSVAENFIYRLKKNDNPSGLVLMSTLLRLMDEVNRLIDSHMAESSVPPADPNLPPRMEMVSDLLSDELKTWGAQHPSHYQSLNNILHHLILDIHFARNGNFDLKELNDAPPPNQNVNSSSSKKSSILKTRKKYDYSGRQRHISMNEESSYSRERNENTYRSTQSEEMSLSNKLLQENALKVQRLEKAYKINHRVRILQRKEENNSMEEAGPEKFSKEARNNSISEKVGNEDKSEHSEDSKRQLSSKASSSNSSHPVVAIISPSQNDSVEEEEHTSISERASETEDKSVVEELQEDQDRDSDSIIEEDEAVSKPTEEPKSQENTSDKQVSDAEEEVEEVLSESSQPAEKQKESAASDYDEDFEADVTENPSQSVTASHNDKEKIGKRSRSRNMGVDEVCQTDDIELPNLKFGDIKQGDNNPDIIGKNEITNIVIVPEDNRQVLNERYDNGQFLTRNAYEPCKDGQGLESKNNQPIHLWRNPDQRAYQKNIHKPIDLDEHQNVDKLIASDVDNKENNFVKLHVRDEQGEIILSYAGSKQNVENKSSLPTLKEKVLPKGETQSNDMENKLPLSSNINSYIETERKVLENITSNVLKELLDDKIEEILSKYTGKDKFKNNSNKHFDQPSTSGFCSNKEQYTQTICEQNEIKLPSEMKLDLTISEKVEPECTEATEKDEEYTLKSPIVKLNIDKTLRKDAVDEEKLLLSADAKNISGLDNQKEVEKPSYGKQESNELVDVNRYSPDVKLLISMVEELDSSDVEYCEASLKQLSDDEPKNKPEVSNTNLRLHHFNSDEFLVYPRLNPQPSDIKILQYSKDEPRHEVSEDSRQSEYVESIGNWEKSNSQRIIYRSIATECDLKEFGRLHPLPENTQQLAKTNFSSSSTQTVAVTRTSKPFTFPSTSNLVDLIEISCSQSSSSGSGSFRKKNKKVSSASTTNMSPVKSFPHKEPPLNILDLKTNSEIQEILPIIENIPLKSELSEPSSTAHSETNTHNLSTHLNNRSNLSGGNTEQSEQNDEISSTSNETERSSPSDMLDSQSRLTGPIMRVLEVSAARPAAWSTSSDSTTDDERIFILNQPVSDDDVLGDLEQLMDYLKNSKSSTSNVRMRQCSRHKKT